MIILGGSHLPVELSSFVWVWSGITALLVFLILLTQVLVVARSGISTVDRSRARPDRPPIFQRFYLDILMIILGGSHLPVELSSFVWVWSGITALLVFLILLTQVLVVARSGISTVDRSRARPDRPPIFQRFYLDILMIILGGFFVWEISSRGIATAQRDGGIATDITLLFAPVMLLISTALLILRLFPVVAGVSYSIATRFTSASLAIGFWRLGRDPYWYSWPILLLILGTGLGVMVGTLGSTLERSAREQIYYDNGTSLRILPGGMSTKVDSEDMSDLGWLCQT
jgi:heme exporter protein D